MTDKQEVIIDGVDVSGCEKYPLSNKWHGSIIFCKGGCKAYPNCEYKQLQRKTAECEELKKILSYPKYTNEFAYDELLKLSKEEFIKNLIESHQHGESVTQCVYKPLKEENTKYKQALDEIEQILNKTIHKNGFQYESIAKDIGKILGIIGKVKGE